MGVPAVAALLVPEWYLDAFRNGVSQEKRRAMVREHVLKDAEGAAVPDEAVALTYEMYEFALSMDNGVQ